MFRIAAALCFGLMQAWVYAENLLINGGFEAGDLTGWTVFNPGGHAAEVRVTADPERVAAGHYALTVNSFAGEKDPLKLLAGASVAELEPGALVRARVMIRAEGLELQGARDSFSVMLAAMDAQGAVLVTAPWNATLAGTWEYFPNEVLLSLPPGVARVELHLTLSSGVQRGSVQVDEVSLEVVEQFADVPGALPEHAVKRDAGGTPRLWIDGEKRTPGLFFGNHGSPVIYEEIAKAAQAGVDIVQIPLALPWSGASTGMIEQVVRANPKAVVLPRLFLHPPKGWMERHPDQLIMDENHQPSPLNHFASMASDVFFDECKQQIALLIQFLEQSPVRDRILGYHPDYMAECFFYYEMDKHFYDYSEVNRARFTRWLKAKYGDVAALNRAWGKGLARFDDAQIPPAEDWKVGDDGLFRDPANPRAVAVADYQLYFNNLTAERLIELAEWIKELTQDRALVAYFYGMQNEFIINGHFNGIAHSGHLGMRKVLASPAIDMICAPASYHDRAPGGPMNMMGVVDSVTLAGKIYLEEDDSRTWLWTEPPPPDYWALKTEWDTLQCLRRNFGNVLGHNQAIWWMDLTSNGNFNAESIWDSNRKIIETYTDSIAHELPTRPEVALIYDEDTFFWLKSNCRGLTSPNLVAQRSVFQTLGAQVGYYYIEDLPRLPESVRLVVFVSAVQVTPEKEALIEALKGEGRTLLWQYAVGYAGAEDLSIERMERLTGFALRKYDETIYPEIRMGDAAKGIDMGLEGMLTGSTETTLQPIAPTFYGTGEGSGTLVLGRYTANDQPAVLLKEHAGWTSIFYGSPLLSTPVLRAICRRAGVSLLVDGDNLETADAINYNGRYLYAYARGHAGTRTFQLPGEPLQPVDVREVISGRLIAEGVTGWSDAFAENEQKVYQLLPVH